MKRPMLKKEDTKQGVASLYAVVFATILFGVITVSFTKIIISETIQSSNDDLSQSAYDAALAGVEDAKAVINRYYECLNAHGAGGCNAYNLFDNDNDCSDGFPLAEKLYGFDGEVLIQESGAASGGDGGSYDQAYTCVLVSDKTPDYRGTLTSDTRTKVIPLSVNNGTSNSTNLSEVATVQFSWYSSLNQGSNMVINGTSTSNFSGKDGGLLPDATNILVPPVIQLTLIKTNGGSVNLNDFHQENNTNESVNSTLVFAPSTATTKAEKAISWTDIDSAGSTHTDDTTSNIHVVQTVDCGSSAEFACTVNLQVNGKLHTGDNAILVASLPYGDAYTDFAVKLLKADDTIINFQGAQISVDSTGRTNQLFRRVESRLDPADLFFPYPQYALEIDGTGEDATIKKNFWVTANCWTEQATCNNNGDL